MHCMLWLWCWHSIYTGPQGMERGKAHNLPVGLDWCPDVKYGINEDMIITLICFCLCQTQNKFSYNHMTFILIWDETVTIDIMLDVLGFEERMQWFLSVSRSPSFPSSLLLSLSFVVLPPPHLEINAESPRLVLNNRQWFIFPAKSTSTLHTSSNSSKGLFALYNARQKKVFIFQLSHSWNV